VQSDKAQSPTGSQERVPSLFSGNGEEMVGFDEDGSEKSGMMQMGDD